MPLTEAEWDKLEGLIEDGCRRAVHAIMTGNTGMWANPDRPGWEWYTDEVRASATRHLLGELRAPDPT